MKRTEVAAMYRLARKGADAEVRSVDESRNLPMLFQPQFRFGSLEVRRNNT